MKNKYLVLVSFFIFKMVLSAQVPDVLMHNGKVRICEATIKDSEAGLTTGDYGHNENMVMTIIVPGASSLKLVFTSFCTEKDEDILRIFDGKDTSATLLGTYSGTAGPGTINSSDSFITLHFKSDQSVACTGWSANLTTTIIVPPQPVLSLNGAVKCNDGFVLIKSTVNIPCDSLLVSNSILTGPKTLGIASISPVGCSGGVTKNFKVNFSNIVNLNGTYTYKLTTNWVDFCGNTYSYTSSVNFTVLTCPLNVSLTADTLVCKGSCTQLVAAASGGNSANYQYIWSPAGLSGPGPHTICPTVKTLYKLTVTDGISIPSTDSIWIDVKNPPTAQKDTTVCYKSGNFFLKASPAGGTWFGSGIVNNATGEYDPNAYRGKRLAWYKVGFCADTVKVVSSNAWALENVFCQGTAAKPLWWSGPGTGTYTGPRVTPTGIFDPDTTAGKYILEFDWNGCKVNKTVEIVQKISVPRYDTTCQSYTTDTLQFAPKGIIPSWFPGLLNYYWGAYNPSAMGGVQTRLITWSASGCKDSTYLTVLGIDAGKNDTFCPANGLQKLVGFTPNTNYTWTLGKGIVSPTADDYNPSFSQANFAIDTLELTSGKCADRKYVYLIKPKVNNTDTLKFCFEDAPIKLNSANTGLSPAGGYFTGPGIFKSDSFLPALAGYGMHAIVYNHFGCTDTIHFFIRPKPIIQSDTNVCINSSQFTLFKQGTGGSWTGNGVINANLGIFKPNSAGVGSQIITYTSAVGCKASFTITVDSMPSLSFTNTPTDYCLKTASFPLQATQSPTTFSGPGVVASTFNPNLVGSGAFNLGAQYILKSCTATATLPVVVRDTLKLIVNPLQKQICPGELVWLQAQATGGDPAAYLFSWSNGKTGVGTFVSPSTSTIYTCSLSDGCSDNVQTNIPITVNAKPLFKVHTSAPVCFGGIGYAVATFPTKTNLDYSWNTFPVSKLDSIRVPAGNSYRLSVTNTLTGCTADTNVTIPGYKAISAGFSTYIANGDVCISNIYPTLNLFDNSQGGLNGTWYWGDGSTTDYTPGSNPSHNYTGLQKMYSLKLVISNAGGCIDSAFSSVCYKDTLLIFAPNAFNPVGQNSSFRISAIGPTQLEVIIYNRWGQIVYRSSDLNFEWDGTYQGKPCPEGLYSYTLQYKTPFTGLRQQHGSVYLIRANN